MGEIVNFVPGGLSYEAAKEFRDRALHMASINGRYIPLKSMVIALIWYAYDKRLQAETIDALHDAVEILEDPRKYDELFTGLRAALAAIMHGGPVGLRCCRVCGCTDNRACKGGCLWVEADLCSRCDKGGA